jgi:hypothetical protein
MTPGWGSLRELGSAMHLLYCDESNLQRSKHDFFIYGGLAFESASALPLPRCIDTIRPSAGVRGDSVLKFNPARALVQRGVARWTNTAPARTTKPAAGTSCAERPMPSIEQSGPTCRPVPACAHSSTPLGPGNIWRRSPLRGLARGKWRLSRGSREPESGRSGPAPVAIEVFMRSTSLFIVLALLAGPTATTAQSVASSRQSAATVGPADANGSVSTASRPPWYFGVAGFGSTTPEGGDRCPYLCGKLGGWSFGGAFVAGVVVGSPAGTNISVESEASINTSIEAPASVRTFDYLEGGGRTFTASRRSMFVSLFMRVGQPTRPKRVSVEAAGGLVLDLARESQIDGVNMVFQGYDKPIVRVQTPDVSSFAAAIGVGGGVDLVTAVGGRRVLTFGARLYRFRRSNYDGTQEFPIPGSLAARIQVGLRWPR